MIRECLPRSGSCRHLCRQRLQMLFADMARHSGALLAPLLHLVYIVFVCSEKVDARWPKARTPWRVPWKRVRSLWISCQARAVLLALQRRRPKVAASYVNRESGIRVVLRCPLDVLRATSPGDTSWPGAAIISAICYPCAGNLQRFGQSSCLLRGSLLMLWLSTIRFSAQA